MIGLLYRIIIGRFKEKTWTIVHRANLYDEGVKLPTGIIAILQCDQTGELKKKRLQ